MTGKRRLGKTKRRMFDANLTLPTDILPTVRDWLDALPVSPKYTYLKQCIFEKFVSPDTDPADVRRRRAIEKWLAIEAVNEETNLRLSSTPPDTVLLPGVRYEQFVEKCREIIASIIGDVPEDTHCGSFSGGASTSKGRTMSTPAHKFVGKAHVSRACVNHFEPDQYESWLVNGLPTLQLVDYSKMFTVPKSTTIDRVACKEPDINMFLQKGAGYQIRRALRKCGIDLNDQSRNRRLAQEGSKYGKLATLDLSSASDSISYEIVFQLMPPIWFSYLNSIRSSRINIDGEVHCCEMFSSMGNGFTFELESLLFFALARTTAYFTGTKGVISVYGDDIIIPVDMDVAFRHILFYFGFQPNVSKSFSSGPFRESCGGHYWNGDDITPFFIRRPIKKLTDLIHFLNSLRIWAGRGQSLFLDSEAWPLWSLLAIDVPRKFKGGDCTSAGTFQLISPDLPRKRLVPVSVKRTLPESGKYLHALNTLEDRNGLPGYLEDSEDTIVRSACRSRRADHWTWHDYGLMFYEETETCHPG